MYFDFAPQLKPWLDKYNYLTNPTFLSNLIYFQTNPKVQSISVIMQ